LAPAYSWFLALRYLLARWVNVLGMAGVAVAVWALIVVISVFSGFISEIREHIREATADLVLTAVKDDCSYSATAEVLERDDDVVATAPRLIHHAILFPFGTFGGKPLQLTRATGLSPLRSSFVVMIGIDPECEAAATEMTSWLQQVKDEEPLFAVPDVDKPLDVPEVLHKRALASGGREVPRGPMFHTGPALLLSLRRMTSGELLTPGLLVDAVSARFEQKGGKQNVVRIKRQFVTVGAFETHHNTFDDVTAFVPIDVMRSMLGQDPDLPGAIDLVNEIAIKVRPGADLEVVKERLAAATHDVAGGVVKTWEEQNEVFLAAVDHERALMKIVLFAVMLVAAFLIYATLHMMVTQKVKDVGILTSMGAAPGGIAAIFVFGGCAIATVGCSVGAGLGLLSAHYLNDVNDWCHAHLGVELFPTKLYDLDRIPYRVEPEWVAQVLIAAFVLTLLVAYFPARRAARLDPVKALSYE